jgi:hypothetical protein
MSKEKDPNHELAKQRLNMGKDPGPYYADLSKKYQNQQAQKQQAQKSGGSGGCFVATAAYGDYDAPEVVFLRRYRDESLRKGVLGRAFIQAYYAVSPPLARLVTKSELLRAGVRKFILQPMIFLLRYLKH